MKAKLYCIGILLLLACSASGQLVLAFDYPATNNPIAWYLFDGINIAGTSPGNVREVQSTTMALGNHSFSVAGYGSDGWTPASAVLAIRIARLSIQTAPTIAGPWTEKTNLVAAIDVGTNLFVRGQLITQ